ncbi:hypothetical protein PV379_01605 [Streptomyces caniscabiei]|uniref:hypothetical protein n=1 Tax=Streptomyces caniscabiei TaxID=2746961 RepID=UPI0029AF29EC|nr:hypothetical protein [Streptomyces caniscabiei]MDX2776049.1 hypothetical protein [Streptomyces caniscabiei]
MSREIPNGKHEWRSERHVDLSTLDWTERLAKAPIYKKTALVHIRPAIPGERIVTTLADGSEETSNIAGEQDVVVTNPGGEEQIVDLEVAIQRYDLTEIPGVFQAKGMVRAIDNPFAQPIMIRAPWGSVQRGNAECKIAVLYDPLAPDVISMDRYIIGGDEFKDTYGVVMERIPNVPIMPERDPQTERQSRVCLRIGETSLLLATLPRVA